MRILISCFILVAAFGAITEHSYTIGMQNGYIPLNYRGEGTVDVSILYTNRFLKDVTVWMEGEANEGWESDFDDFYESEKNQLYL